MYNAITLSMPAIWHGWRDGEMSWHQHDKSDAVCKITSAKRTRWTEKYLVHWIGQKVEKCQIEADVLHQVLNPGSWHIATSLLVNSALPGSILVTKPTDKCWPHPHDQTLSPLIQSTCTQTADWGWSLASVDACASSSWAQGSLEWFKTMPGKAWTI